MNLLDYILLAVVLISVITAAMKGFFYEIWMMAAAIAAILLAAWNYEAAAGWFRWLGSTEAAHVCGFITVLVLVLVAAAITGRIIRKAMHAVGLSIPDHLLGAGLGLIRGVLLCMAVLAVLIAYPIRPGLIAQSHFAPDLLWGSRALVHVVPTSLATRFHDGITALTAHVRSLP